MFSDEVIESGKPFDLAQIKAISNQLKPKIDIKAAAAERARKLFGDMNNDDI